MELDSASGLFQPENSFNKINQKYKQKIKVILILNSAFNNQGYIKNAKHKNSKLKQFRQCQHKTFLIVNHWNAKTYIIYTMTNGEFIFSGVNDWNFYFCSICQELYNVKIFRQTLYLYI